MSYKWKIEMKELKYQSEDYRLEYDDESKSYSITVDSATIIISNLQHFRIHLELFAKALDELNITK